MTIRLPILSAIFCALLPHIVHAQLFSYDREAPRATQSIAAMVALVAFEYAGDGEPEIRFDYSGAAYGLQYARPNLHVAVVFGQHVPEVRFQSEKLHLLDASLFTWGEIHLTRATSAGQTRVFIPILIHSSHRRISGDGVPAVSSIDAFSVTIIGLGTGLGLNSTVRRLQIEARATPVIGFATRSFGEATGSSRLFDGDVLFHLGPVVGAVGVSFGYGFRAQSWNVGSSNLLQDEDDDLFNYAGHHHAFRVGINW